MARTVPPGSCASPRPTRPSRRAAPAALPPAAASAASSAARSRSPTARRRSKRRSAIARATACAFDAPRRPRRCRAGPRGAAALAAQHAAREVRQQQLAPRPLVHQRLEDHVAQLADVAGPRIRAQRRQRGRRRALDLVTRRRLRLLAVEPPREVADQRGQIGDALAQRRHPDRHDRQPLVEIGAERARRAQRDRDRGWWRRGSGSRPPATRSRRCG